ncbi:MAG TPA: N-acetyltransferase [Myxococcaceae bacterium]|nr:N-acetyltransferase [Myxococcaceae bacterium]
MAEAAPIRVSPVQTSEALDRFVHFPARLYRNNPFYVAPLYAERKDFLTPKRNPFLRHAEVQLFLAHRGDQVVGRVAAVNDARYNQFHNTEFGFFGMFECVDDVDVAGALFDAAAGWASAKGLRRLVGPVNLSVNHDCGLLISGFDDPPAMMMPYNPPYYAALFERHGFQKQLDLWAYEVSPWIAPPEGVVREAEKARLREGVRVRSLDPHRFSEELVRLKRVYASLADGRLDFVPMTDEEFDGAAARLRHLVRVCPELVLVAEIQGEPVAFSLTLPDGNFALREADGYLTRFGLPWGLLKLCWAARKIDRLRVLMLGVTPEYRFRGIETVLSLETLRIARELGYVRAELGWTSEEDAYLNTAIEALGGRRYKTYRLYQRPLPGMRAASLSAVS